MSMAYLLSILLLYFHMLFIYFIYHIHFVSLTLYFLYLYTCHFLLCFMSANTLEADTGNNCLYLKVLYIPEGIITVRDSDLCLVILYPKVSSLYEIVTYAL